MRYTQLGTKSGYQARNLISFLILNSTGFRPGDVLTDLMLMLNFQLCNKAENLLTTDFSNEILSHTTVHFRCSPKSHYILNRHSSVISNCVLARARHLLVPWITSRWPTSACEARCSGHVPECWWPSIAQLTRLSFRTLGTLILYASEDLNHHRRQDPVL